ncbi:MAG: ZIP family metal transporter [Clostridia bacterium]|nr:ZIP family metal transporter [Clostridia bacterium]
MSTLHSGSALLIAAGLCFPFLMTTLGAAAVFLLRRVMPQLLRRSFLGFAAGVMLAASVWSLLNPAIAAAEAAGVPGWIPAAGGVIAGVLFLLFTDLAATRLMQDCEACRSSCDYKCSRSAFLLQFAMTVHNIPEGMAVGMSFALAAQQLSATTTTAHEALSAAIALSLGVGIQNFPEGAAISLPLRQDGMSSCRAFWHGCLSGIVEPIFGAMTLLLFGDASAVLPWLLSFAAGAMLYVVAEELIPQASGGCTPEMAGDGHDAPKHVSCIGTLSVMTGFLLMMILDVALG